jgi:hypothetical protein
MYERDGSPRPSWFDPLGFAGLDQVPPPPREIEALEREQERIGERQGELERLIPEETALLQELGVRLDSMRGSPHLASESEVLDAQAADRSAKLRALRKERFENEALLFTHFSERYTTAEIRTILDRRLPESLRARVTPLVAGRKA